MSWNPVDIEIIASPFCPPGKVFLVKTPIAYEHTLLRLLEPEPSKFELPASIRYGFELRFPKMPACVMLTNLEEHRTCRQIWRDLMAMGERWKLRRQRRLDYRSNVCRRKRWAELSRRRVRG